MKLGFETTYTINVLRRLLTLPVRPHLPAFYIVGFPVSLTKLPQLSQLQSAHVNQLTVDIQ